MSGFSHILFPVDFSDRCVSAIPHVKEMMRRHNSKLTLLHVVEVPIAWYGAMQAEWAFAGESPVGLIADGQEDLKRFRDEHFADSGCVQMICEFGAPARAIVADAENIGADLIMMPTHGEGPFRSFLLGSVTTSVLHRAHCPVWTAAHLEDHSAEHVEVKKILCALDLEKESARVLKYAAELGTKLGAEVRLVHSVPPPQAATMEQFNYDFEHFLSDSAKNRAAALQKEVGTSFELTLEAGSVADVVKEAASWHTADLIVIGRGHVQAPFAGLRTNAHAIIRTAPCPVLSLL
jgi:nucleotide-binding universal stress UspA family protein